MALVHRDQRGAAIVVAGIGGGKGHPVDGVCMMVGSVPGVLFHIFLVCVCFVNLRTRWAVGLGAAIIGGAFVMRWRVEMLSATLCSTLCAGGMIAGTL
jgi:hypothetical protein